jgi:hypothetical protein
MAVRHRRRSKQVSSSSGKFEPFAAARREGKAIANPSAFLRKKLPKLHGWLEELFGRCMNFYVSLRDRTVDGEPTWVSLSIWSADHVFHISALGGRNGYLGAGMSARRPLAGESHCRASDLYDGDFSEKTWRCIVQDVWRNCLVPIHSRPPMQRKPQRRTSAKIARKPAA